MPFLKAAKTLSKAAPDFSAVARPISSSSSSAARSKSSSGSGTTAATAASASASRSSRVSFVASMNALSLELSGVGFCAAFGRSSLTSGIDGASTALLESRSPRMLNPSS